MEEQPPAFVYRWKSKTTGMMYVGYHVGRDDDSYVASSKIFIEHYLQNPDDFEREIIARGTKEEMLHLEEKILTEADAKNDPMYYNKHNGNGKWVSKAPFTKETKEKIGAKARGRPGYRWTEAQKLAASIARKGKPQVHPKGVGAGIPKPADQRRKISETLRKQNLHWYNDGTREILVAEGTQPHNFVSGKLFPGMLGKKHTDEWVQLMRQKMTGRVFSEESRRKMSEAAKRRSKESRKVSEETRRKMSEAAKLREGVKKLMRASEQLNEAPPTLQQS